MSDSKSAADAAKKAQEELKVTTDAKAPAAKKAKKDSASTTLPFSSRRVWPD